MRVAASDSYQTWRYPNHRKVVEIQARVMANRVDDDQDHQIEDMVDLTGVHTAIGCPSVTSGTNPVEEMTIVQ